MRKCVLCLCTEGHFESCLFSAVAMPDFSGYDIGTHVAIRRAGGVSYDGDTGGPIVEIKSHYCLVKCSWGNAEGQSIMILGPQDMYRMSN